MKAPAPRVAAGHELVDDLPSHPPTLRAALALAGSAADIAAALAREAAARPPGSTRGPGDVVVLARTERPGSISRRSAERTLFHGEFMCARLAASG